MLGTGLRIASFIYETGGIIEDITGNGFIFPYMLMRLIPIFIRGRSYEPDFYPWVKVRRIPSGAAREHEFGEERQSFQGKPSRNLILYRSTRGGWAVIGVRPRTFTHG